MNPRPVSPCGPSLQWQLQPPKHSVWLRRRLSAEISETMTSITTPHSVWLQCRLSAEISEIMTSITTSNSNPHKEAVFEPEGEAFSSG